MTDEDQTIWLSRSENRRKRYHTDPNCNYLGENPHKTTLKELNRSDMRECKYCSGEWEAPRDTGRSDAYLALTKKAAERESK